ncbi:outer membrane protein assembly factor BamA [Derxia lacustris]|uniref:outer membrane protein assembly factor BamA n=1 Tax=Derxia lacustris TaxID=764842 RepID=UPI000A176A29
MTRSRIAAAVFAACMTPAAYAVDPFVIKDIRVEGVQRTEPGTVFSYLPFRIGDSYNDEKGAAAIRALYAAGFYRDVRLEVEGETLVVTVEERPAISSINFSGAKEFEADKLKQALRDVGIAEARTFDRSQLDRAEQELKRLYLSRGKYAVSISTTVTPQERNRVAINFTIEEGDVATIKQIHFVGTKAFTEKELLKEIQLTTPGWFTWFSKRDQYSKQKLTADLETLRSFYLNRGYLEFNVESTQVSITPDKRDIYITVAITEGQKYTVSDVKLAGDLLDKRAELETALVLKPGQTFSGQDLNDSIKQINEKLGNYGYAFSNANASPDIDREKSTVAFTIVVDPGRRVYVRRVNIAGNARTRDEVIRRESRQLEGGYFDGERVRQSRDRIDRLGFFEEVKVDSPAVSAAPDLLDVNYTVKERATGTLNVGAGFSSTDKLVLTASISQNNLFGTGNSLSFEVNTSKVNRTFAISQTNPYFTVDGISQGFDIYTRTYNPTSLNLGDYKVRSTGAGVRFGFPVSDFNTVVFGLNAENTDITVGSASPSRYKQYVDLFGESSTGATASLAWINDTRDSGLAPTRGRYGRASIEATLPVFDLRYYRATVQQQWFKPITRDFTFALNGEADYGKGFGGKPLPLFKYYYAGGIGTVRGFEPGSLTTTRDSNGYSLGGASRVFGNAEFLFPLPGTSDRTVRLFTFLDGGNTFPEGEGIKFSNLRYSTGFGVSWLSPVGPLKLSLGKPLNSKPGDREQRFQFQLGTGF